MAAELLVHLILLLLVHGSLPISADKISFPGLNISQI